MVSLVGRYNLVARDLCFCSCSSPACCRKDNSISYLHLPVNESHRPNDRANHAPVFGVWLSDWCEYKILITHATMKRNKNHKTPVASCRDIKGESIHHKGKPLVSVEPRALGRIWFGESPKPIYLIQYHNVGCQEEIGKNVKAVSLGITY